MEFRIHAVPVPVREELGPGVRKIAAAPKLVWELMDKHEESYCRSSAEFDTEAQARADIARFKRVASKACRFARIRTT